MRKALANWIRKMQKKGSDRPRNSPSIFEGVRKSYLPQTLVLSSRNDQKRKIDFDSRNSSSKKQKVDKNVKNLLFNLDVTDNFYL